jgi:hypothetical protein
MTMTRLRCPGPPPLSRRQLLQVGTAGLLGLSLPRLLQAGSHRTDPDASADACILLFLNGGPSHLDMWDMKPDAPAEVRGEFKPIPSTVPGVPLGEHLPRLAKKLHLCSLVRSVHHSVNNAHAAAVYTSLTGHDRGDANVAIGANPNDYPSLGSVLSVCRPGRDPNVPPCVALPYITQEGKGGPPQPGFFGGLLGRNLDPMWVLRDPNRSDFGMPELSLGVDVSAERLDARRQLIEQLGGEDKAERKLQEMDGFQARAFDLLTSEATQAAFRIDREPRPVRESYGRNIYGQSTLLARRLIEAGTRVVTLSWAPDANATWDTHGQNFTKLKNELLPQLDMALSSLLTDLEERGLLKRTLVVVMGEFGRTPKVNAGAGRDHWNYCYGLLLAGGGIKQGYVHGSSDRIGARPSSNPVTPADIVATIYQCLGVSADLEMQDRLQRPFQLVPWGRVIPELLTA